MIDDATVETPGVCHVESWVTRHDGRRGLLNASPACTRTAWPWLEIGGAIQHIGDGADDTTVGPALKLNVLPVESGIGLALIGSGAWSIRNGTLQTASVIVPVTIAISERIRTSFNAGLLYSHTSALQFFFGAQVEVEIARDLALMVEAFGRDHSHLGGQIGLRWNPNSGWLDIDLLAGRWIDGVSPDAITLGLTLRI